MKEAPSAPVRKAPGWPEGRGRSKSPKSGGASSPAPPAPALQSAPAAERCLAELVRYYRHSGVGRNCRGIAHQMSGPIQVISFLLELLEQKSQAQRESLPECPGPGAEKLQRFFASSLERIQRFRQEVDSLQQLARNLVRQGVHEENQDRVYLNLTQIYRQELELYLAQPLFKHQVEKHFSFSEGLPDIYGYYIDFSQSFRNLVDNALEAMEGAQEQRLRVETAFDGKHRVLRIGDNGRGIPPELQPRLFEPFFTTKGPGRAGLGLFMARRLLTPYQAEFRVDSVPGETWVTVSLPVR